MTIALILLFSILTVLFGRWMFDRWFNHVGLYGATWGLSLALFHIGLIRYYPLETETWMIIIFGWIFFVVGSFTIGVIRYVFPNSIIAKRDNTTLNLETIKSFTVILWVLNIVITLEAIHHTILIANLIGGLTNFSKVANLIYQLRVKEGIPGMIPYLSSSSFAACLLAGIYASRKGTIQAISFLPLFVTILDSILNMSRGPLIIGCILFASGYTISRKKQIVLIEKTNIGKIKRAVAISLAIIIFAFGIEFVRSSRGIIESFSGTSTALSKTKEYSFITPSVFFYSTGHFGVLNQYLKKDDERMIFGAYSLAPFWRLISKLGYPTYVKQNQPFYMTPASGNNGTYLRELHADYGLLGTILGPYFLGLVSTWYWFRARQSQKILHIMILGHILVVVAMSIFLIVTQWGYWLASLIFGMILAHYIDLFYDKRKIKEESKKI